jgi:hypothetical protein
MLLAALTIVITACDGADAVAGVITEVDASSVVEWESIVVETQDGERLTFLPGDAVDLRFWSASHLREHMLSGHPVEVTYESREGALVATEIDDAS